MGAISQGMTTLSAIVESGKLRKDEVNAAVAAAKRNGWIRFGRGGTISALQARESAEEQILKKLLTGPIQVSDLDEDGKAGYSLLIKRPGYVQQRDLRTVRIALTETGRAAASMADAEPRARRLTSQMITSGEWKEMSLAPLDVAAAAPIIFPGRTHPLADIIDEIKEIFVGLGFEEVDGSMVQSSFWNFDALYIPQDHSAREMQDTFYLKDQKGDIESTRDHVRNVARTHAVGWGGTWNKDEASRPVLRTHTTPVTLRHLANAKSSAARFFSVGRVFRNEKPSYKHLVEFHQVEGVATGQRLSLRDLMGLQKEFYGKMGIRKVKFWPTFFPYTEPSLQSMVFNDKLQKWVELFGMGIFRPEVAKPLGITNPVLAWGGGIERIAMMRYGLDDVRDLYGSRLSWLRSVPKCPS
jgi:phenylalanyl-tRNA synthetase alpha chain